MRGSRSAVHQAAQPGTVADRLERGPLAAVVREDQAATVVVDAHHLRTGQAREHGERLDRPDPHPPIVEDQVRTPVLRRRQGHLLQRGDPRGPWATARPADPSAPRPLSREPAPAPRAGLRRDGCDGRLLRTRANRNRHRQGRQQHHQETDPRPDVTHGTPRRGTSGGIRRLPQAGCRQASSGSGSGGFSCCGSGTKVRPAPDRVVRRADQHEPAALHLQAPRPPSAIAAALRLRVHLRPARHARPSGYRSTQAHPTHGRPAGLPAANRRPRAGKTPPPWESVARFRPCTPPTS